ncbi:MAG: protein phosphatase 2C domain-containing protein [Rhodocyclaceae bacterium]|nr:protein phosphatase 2C domain-containing protein [Rhodocyclaceae bacterium]
MPLTVDACVAQHQGDRKEQQDRVAIFPHPRIKGVAMAVVADGMGGHTGGALAAEQVIHTAKNSLANFAPAEETPQMMLESSMREAHTMIKASRFINEKDPHSTAVMLVLQPGKVTWAHCGDSRLYHFCGEQLVNRTVDHSYVEHLLSIGRITPEQALTHPNRNVLLTSLGGQDEPKFSFAESMDAKGGDSFVLCSDGLWAYFDDVELGGVVASFSARQASEILLERARERGAGGGDNISLAIIKLVEIAATKPKPPTGFVPRARL